MAPPPRHPRFPLMEGLRALAALTVLGVHAASATGEFSAPLIGPLLARMNIGVTVFFLISGFLLYRPMIAWRGGEAPAPPVAQYFKRRVLRIFPAYWTILTLLLVVPGLGSVDPGGAWPMYALVHTLVGGSACTREAYTCGLAHTWSLVAELTFYAILPLLAAGLGTLTARLSLHSWLVAQLGVLALLAAASVLAQFAVLTQVPVALANTAAGYALWFALGMGLAVISVWARAQDTPPRALAGVAAHPGAVWTLAAALYVALSAWLPANTFLLARGQVLATHLAYAAIAALALLPAVFDGGHGWPRRVLTHPVIAWVGLVSYGIFLWHYVVTLQLGPNGAHLAFVPLLVLTLLITVALAAVSYYAVERPLLALKYARLGDLLGRPHLIHRDAASAPDRRRERGEL